MASPHLRQCETTCQPSARILPTLSAMARQLSAGHRSGLGAPMGMPRVEAPSCSVFVRRTQATFPRTGAAPEPVRAGLIIYYLLSRPVIAGSTTYIDTMLKVPEVSPGMA